MNFLQSAALRVRGTSGWVDIVVSCPRTNSADPDSKDENGWNPLLIAAWKGHGAVVTLLLATNGVDPDSKDSGSCTPLWWATEKEHKVIVKKLLEKGGRKQAFGSCGLQRRA
jgi:ankyrin repeat protein